jgi:hypothetical protein
MDVMVVQTGNERRAPRIDVRVPGQPRADLGDQAGTYADIGPRTGDFDVTQQHVVILP